MPKFKIQMDDTVIVTTGKHKGATGRVIDVDIEDGCVFIE
jgi:ribosomal protein L24